MEELIVRINNLMHLSGLIQRHSDKRTVIKIGAFEFNYGKFELAVAEEKIMLSHRENELVKLFAEHQNKQIDRRLILKAIWGDDSMYNSRNLDVYIRKLRVYFEKDPHIELKTLRGVGYHLVVTE